MNNSVNNFELTENDKELFDYVLKPFPNGLTKKGISGVNRERAKAQEKTYCNYLLTKNFEGKSGQIGELIVHRALELKGLNPEGHKTFIDPENNVKYIVDNAVKDYIIEVKTRSWTNSGTAGEKVPGGCAYKYSEVPELAKKSLKIICVGYQEWELCNDPKLKVFFDDYENIPQGKKIILECFKELNIEYIKFSDFISDIYSLQ